MGNGVDFPNGGGRRGGDSEYVPVGATQKSSMASKDTSLSAEEIQMSTQTSLAMQILPMSTLDKMRKAYVRQECISERKCA
jgi:hypothetical protein